MLSFLPVNDETDDFFTTVAGTSVLYIWGHSLLAWKDDISRRLRRSRNLFLFLRFWCWCFFVFSTVTEDLYKHVTVPVVFWAPTFMSIFLHTVVFLVSHNTSRSGGYKEMSSIFALLTNSVQMRGEGRVAGSQPIAEFKKPLLREVQKSGLSQVY